MKQYWPCAIYRTKDGKLDRLSVYDSSLDLARARQSIATWRDWYKYNLRRAWIDVYEDGTKIETIRINPRTDEITKGGSRNVPSV